LNLPVTTGRVGTGKRQRTGSKTPSALPFFCFLLLDFLSFFGLFVVPRIPTHRGFDLFSPHFWRPIFTPTGVTVSILISCDLSLGLLFLLASQNERTDTSLLFISICGRRPSLRLETDVAMAAEGLLKRGNNSHEEEEKNTTNSNTTGWRDLFPTLRCRPIITHLSCQRQAQHISFVEQSGSGTRREEDDLFW